MLNSLMSYLYYIKNDYIPSQMGRVPVFDGGEARQAFQKIHKTTSVLDTVRLFTNGACWDSWESPVIDRCVQIWNQKQLIKNQNFVAAS